MISAQSIEQHTMAGAVTLYLLTGILCCWPLSVNAEYANHSSQWENVSQNSTLSSVLGAFNETQAEELHGLNKGTQGKEGRGRAIVLGVENVTATVIDEENRNPTSAGELGNVNASFIGGEENGKATSISVNENLAFVGGNLRINATASEADFATESSEFFENTPMAKNEDEDRQNETLNTDSIRLQNPNSPDVGKNDEDYSLGIGVGNRTERQKLTNQALMVNTSIAKNSSNGSSVDGGRFSTFSELTTRITSSSEDFAWNCSHVTNLTKICGCSPACRKMENCCYDSDFLSYQGADTKMEYSCYTGMSDKLVLSQPGRLLDRCPLTWKNESVRRLCESPVSGNVFGNVPCFSASVGLSFRNDYCRICNAAEDCELWDVSFQANFPLPFQYIDTVEKMIGVAGRPLLHRGYQFVAGAKQEFEPSHCLPNTIDVCKEEYNSDDLSKACQAYYFPVLIDGNVYRNKDCYTCHTGHKNVTGRFVVLRNHLSMMSVLLDLRPLKSANGEMDSQGEHWSPRIKAVRGYIEIKTFYMFVSFSNDTEAFANEKEILQMHDVFYNALKRGIKQRLGGLKPTTRLYHLALQLNKVVLATVTITVTDTVLVSDLSVIKEAIDEVNFEIPFTDDIVIRCCRNNTIQENESVETEGQITETNTSKSHCLSCAAAPVASLAQGSISPWVPSVSCIILMSAYFMFVSTCI